jgi:tRNA dimethylallyltransferase
MKNKLVAVIGPTATGKTQLGVKLAYRFNGEILSADSRQVYKGLDIGTGKDLHEFTYKDTTIDYHLIDIIEPAKEYNIFRYKSDFIKAFIDVISRGKLPVMVGGSGLYISSVIQDYELKQWDDFPGFNPSSEQGITVAESELQTDSCLIGVHYERAEIRERITFRLKQRLQSGLIEEVKGQLDNNIPPERFFALGLEYKFITLYLLGKLNYNDMYQKLNTSIHAFAKRQMTWFRKMEREGLLIHWINKGDFEEASEIVENFLRK